MVKSLAVELAPKNIRVNAAAPGYVMTEVTERGMSNPEWRGYRINLKLKPIDNPEVRIALCTERRRKVLTRSAGSTLIEPIDNI